MDLHKKISTGLGTAIILIFAITAAAFSFKIYDYQMSQWEREEPDYAVTKTSKKVQPSQDTQLANPASVFCKEHGGKLEIRTGKDGGQVGFCIIEDGKECEEWSYMRGECNGSSVVDASGWKTYRNEKYGFEIKYPKGWERKTRELMVDLGHKDYAWFDSDFSVDVWDTSIYSFDQLKAAPPSSDSQNITEKMIQLDGNVATEVSYIVVGDAGSGSRSGTKITALRNSFVYVIECSVKNCQEVISTFKFIQ